MAFEHKLRDEIAVEALAWSTMAEESEIDVVVPVLPVWEGKRCERFAAPVWGLYRTSFSRGGVVSTVMPSE